MEGKINSCEIRVARELILKVFFHVYRTKAKAAVGVLIDSSETLSKVLNEDFLSVFTVGTSIPEADQTFVKEEVENPRMLSLLDTASLRRQINWRK